MPTFYQENRKNLKRVVRRLMEQATVKVRVGNEKITALEEEVERLREELEELKQSFEDFKNQFE